MMLWVWLLGCQSDATDWPTEFTQDPTVVKRQLLEMTDPVQRLHVVNELQSEFPGQVGDLCTVLEGSAQRYCLEKEKRPHLWMPLKERNVSVVETVESTSVECSDVACRIEKAMSDALRGNIERVQGICQATTNSETHECLFMLAETMVSERGVAKYDTAAAICGLAESFHENCQNHLIQQLAKIAPDADSVSDWSDIMAAHNAIETTWGWRDAALKSRLQSRLWSESLGFSFAGADSIVGNVLDAVPIQYHSHVHSAAAWRIFQLEESRTKNLSGWTEYLQTRLQRRSSKAASLDQQRKFRSASQIGSTAGEKWTADVYLSTAHRWTDERPMLDVTIAILEAVARRPPVNGTLIEEGMMHSEEIVRVTAERLHEHVHRVQP